MWWDRPKANKAPAEDGKPFPFMKIRWLGFIVTSLIFIVTTFSLVTQGLNLGLDFTGGVQIEAASLDGGKIDSGEIRSRLSAAGFEESNVTTTQGGNTVVIRVPIDKERSVEEVSAQAKTALGTDLRELKTDNVEGRVSDKLLMQGILASVLAVVGIGAYVWFRFEVKFGTGAFVTTFHDVYAVIGLFSITQMTFDLTIVAGVLTVAGYSINDTVVVYDRIREMLKKYKKLDITQVIDISITSTLSRTLITSLATGLAAGAMAFLGGPVLFGFAVSIIFGIVIGTYSSIFVAAPMLIHLPGRLPGAKYQNPDGTVSAAR
ncbi:MAG: protein translocase subunit SecF [Alphaproteobacteria bacterium 32-64-14]|nr:MAG: protein translocase subunit SecF [Alphaproteobacteria bacterium 32-64-14]